MLADHEHGVADAGERLSAQVAETAVPEDHHAIGARESELRRLMLRGDLLAFDAVVDFDGAVRIYRRCRAAGVTPRGMVDCMIAAVAWRREATLLAHDADLDRVARVIGIATDEASLRA